MSLVLYKGYPDLVGKRFIWAGQYTGPALYVSGGDTLTLPGFKNYIDTVDSSGELSVSGTYIIRAIPSQTTGERPTWKFKWYTSAAPQTEVSANTVLSAESFNVSGKGGTY